MLDVHLGRLAGYLRMSGFDVVYSNCAGDSRFPRLSGNPDLGSLDDFVLYRACQLHEVGAIAGHSYDQVAVHLGMFLRMDQRLLVDHAELDMLSAL